MPVVLFAQLYSMSKRGGAKDIDARIKDCSAIVEPATVIVEIIPNYDNKTTDFLINKDRFGRTGAKITCAFEKGKYITLSPDEMAARDLKYKLQRQDDKINQLQSIISNADPK